MVARLSISGLLMAACVAVHATGSIAALRWLDHLHAFEDHRFWYVTGVLICVAGWLVGMHLSDIVLWASFYTWGHALPGPHVALYFSAVTYTTVGYGDVVLPEHWRLVGGVEALTGILMCGWSTGAFFSIIHRMAPPRRATHRSA
jgi:hypothetical protein